MLIELGNFRTRAGLNMHFPRRIRQGSGEVTSDPLYGTLLARRLPSFPAFPLGDAHEIARLTAKVVESDEPKVAKTLSTICGSTAKSSKRWCGKSMKSE